MYRKGTGEKGAHLSCAILFLVVTPAFAVGVDPNNGPFDIGDDIVFNYGANQQVFDKSVGAQGSLIDFDSASGAGQITASGYVSKQYTFGIRWSVPLVQDISSFFGEWLATGQFGGDDLTWELVDLENSDTVLLSGTIMDSSTDPNYDFVWGEPPGVSFLISSDGGGEGGLIGLTITGGTLASLYPPEAKMQIQCNITPDPNDFDYDLYTSGSGSVTITAVPEPGAAVLLLGGAVVWLARRRRF